MKSENEPESNIKNNIPNQSQSQKSRIEVLLNHLTPNLMKTRDMLNKGSSLSTTDNQRNENKSFIISSQSNIVPDTLVQFSPFLQDTFKKSKVSYLSPNGPFQTETLQAGVLLVAHPRSEVRRKFLNRLCEAAVSKSLLIYSINAQGSINVDTDGVYQLTTHPTLSRRAILNALLRHGAHLLVFGVINTRDDVMQMLDAVYTGYHVIAEIFGENALDVLSRLEAVGVDTSLLPQNLRIVVPGTE